MKKVLNPAIIFVRTGYVKQETSTLDTKLDCLVNYCSDHKLSVIEKYVSSSISGARRHINDLYEYVEKSNYAHLNIVTYTVTDMFNDFETLSLFEHLIKSGKLSIHFYKDKMLLNKDIDNKTISRLYLGMFSAKFYIGCLSNNIKRSMRFNAEHGRFMGLAPVGYKNVRNSEGRADIVQDDIKAPIVKKLFEEYATGQYSIQSLTKLATDLGLTNRNGKTFSQSCINNMLANPFYYGEMRFNGKLLPHIYKPLIDKSLFDKVQKVMIGRKKPNNLKNK